MALNNPLEVLGQITYFWGKNQNISLSEALAFPVILFLCHLLSRSDWLHLINFTFLEGFPNLGSYATYLILF